METLWPIIAGSLVVALATALWQFRRRAEGQLHRLEAATRELEHLQHAFSRFAPEQVVERILHEGISADAQKKEVTVVFADLLGFTAMGEKLTPERLVYILNGYFERMSRAITNHNGHVSKFIGDGILALFGALEPNPWQVNDATRAALAMKDELAIYNKRLAEEGLPQLAIGIGIHRGMVVAGVIGSDALKEFTVIGADVNLASRIEGLTRRHGVTILISASVREMLDKRFVLREMPPESVKGVTDPVATWSVEGFSAASVSAPATPPA